MRPIRMMTCALLLSTVSAVAQERPGPTAEAAVPANDISGLWRATRRFGPNERARLVITRGRAGYVADLDGRRLNVRSDGALLTFEIPGGRGLFQGRLERGNIRGLWLRPRTEVNGRSASPVRLRSDGRSRWIGEIDPPRDTFTMYLLLRPRSDGSFDAVLRNPERDIGTQQGVSRLVRAGDVVRLLGRRGDAPEREVATGRFDSETGGFTLYVPNRGGTFDFARDDDASFFWPRGRVPDRYRYAPPVAVGDGWRTGSLEDVGIDRAAIERLVQSIIDAPMDSNDAPQIDALLIARHGRLVLEEYFHGYSRDALHNTRSASKSMTAITVGAAMHAGAPLRLDSPVYQVMNGGTFPVDLDDPLKRNMTLEHLLTMSGGWFCDDTNDQAPGNEDRMQDQTEEPDWYRYTLRVPLATPPGVNSVYCSVSPNIALGMVGRATGETPVFTFDRLVAEPMQIDRYGWPLDPAGQPYGGGGLEIRARDFIKFGQLMLNGGVWNGRRILDARFASAATSPQYNMRNVLYGYLWWVEDVPYKDRMVRSYSARGAGGQTVVVIPELDLVVATMASNYLSRIQITYTGALVPRSIMPAVREPGDDPNAPVQDREFTSRYGRSTDGSRVDGRE